MIGFKVSNKGKSKLYTDISSISQGYLDITPGTRDLYPEDYPFRLLVETKTGNYVETAEIVEVTGSPSTDRFTITRAVEPCPVSDSSLEAVQIPQIFNAGAQISLSITAGLYEDLRDGIANSMPLIGGLGQDYGINKTKYIDPATGDEVLKDSAVGTVIPGTSIIEFRDATTGNGIRVPYSVVQADMALASGGSYTVDSFESSISVGEPVGLCSSGLYECTTANKSSINITSSSLTGIHGNIEISAGVFVFFYSVGVALYARVGTLTGDVIAYGTEVQVDSLTTANCTGGIAKIGTDKFIVVYADSNTGSIVRNKVGTVTGTNIALGSVVTYTHRAGYATSILNVVRVRDDVYAINISASNDYKVITFTVSSTTPSVGTVVWSFANSLNGPTSLAYLSDNSIGVVTSYYSSPSHKVYQYIFDIAPAGHAVQTTYSSIYDNGSTSIGNLNLVRYSNTSFVFTFSSGFTTTWLVKKPPSGTTLIVTTLTDNGAGKFLSLLPVQDHVYATIDGTTLNIYQHTIFLGTISGVSTFTAVTQSFASCRFVYIHGANGTLRTVNLANIFYFGIAINNAGGALFRGIISKTGVQRGVMYYLQADGSISPEKSLKYVGKGIATDVLIVG